MKAFEKKCKSLSIKRKTMAILPDFYKKKKKNLAIWKKEV